MKWFTSDWHIGHTNIIKYCNRPFANVQEMDKTILDNFFSVVKKGDTVYFLGDLSFHIEAIKNTLMVISMAGIDFNVLLGNHDDTSAVSRFSHHQFRKNVYRMLDLEIEGQPVTLCHYPMLTFNRSHHGAWQLYGHHHNGGYHKDIPPAVMGKKMNVGVDIHNFMPVSWDQVKEYMKKQPHNFDYISPEDRRKHET
jgi:calcineurin-like phosphoesterase family protein